MTMFLFLVVVAFAAAVVQTLTGQVGAWFGWWGPQSWVKDLTAGFAGAIVGYGLLGVYLWWGSERRSVR